MRICLLLGVRICGLLLAIRCRTIGILRCLRVRIARRPTPITCRIPGVLCTGVAWWLLPVARLCLWITLGLSLCIARRL